MDRPLLKIAQHNRRWRMRSARDDIIVVVGKDTMLTHAEVAKLVYCPRQYDDVWAPEDQAEAERRLAYHMLRLRKQRVVAVVTAVDGRRILVPDRSYGSQRAAAFSSM